MRYLVDGYNLLFAAGVAERKSEHALLPPGRLDAARWRLIRQIADYLGEQDRTRTIIVFDAKHAPPGLPTRHEFSGLRILFARDHDEADDLIEELIQEASTPKKLTVITSDLKLQAAAKRRRASVIDSDAWMVQMEGCPLPVPSPPETGRQAAERKREPRLTDDEVQGWLDEWRI